MNLGFWLILGLSAVLAWVGAQWSLRLPHYKEQRRSVPARTGVVVTLAVLGAGIAAVQGQPWISQLFLALWSVVFALVTVVDIETHFIPDVIVLPAVGFALLASTLDPRLSGRSAFLGALVGFILFFVIVMVARGGFGMGDAKLMAFVGAVTGLLPLFYALLAGIFAGGVGAVILLATRRMSRNAYMPYGPYLCLGGWLGMLPAVVQFWGVLP